MATETTDRVFRQLLTVFSEWYEKCGYTNMLKVLYRDLLKNNYELNKATKVMDLMNLLIASGHLHSTYLNLLYDTINITEQYGLEREIKDILPVFQNVRDVVISKFTHHRRKLMKLGMVLIDEEVKQISGLYNKPVKEYADTWSLIMDLEHNRIICEGKMDAFIEELNTLKLQHAVEALTEEISNASSNSGHGYGEEIAVKLIHKRKRESSEPHPKTYALRLLIELDEHKDTLNVKDMPEFFEKYEKLSIYYEHCGLKWTKAGTGSIVFYLSANDPNALTNIWEIHTSGKLIKDLAELLVPEKHQQEFLNEWMTYIDENEYKAVLGKLKGKGFYHKMATSSLNQFLENVDEKVLECTICFKRLQNPKSLNCLHSFCLACLEDWVKTKGELTCPTCSKSYHIPEGGLQKLPPNTFLNNLLETIEQFSERDQLKCSVCEKEGQVKYYCQDCRKYLCSTCSDQHKKFPAMANHKLHLMEDVQSMSPSQMTLLHPPLCSHHSKPLEFYCTDCATPICVNCILMDHNTWDGKHKSINISDAFQTFKETSAALEKSSQHFINKLEDGLKAVIQNVTQLEQSKNTCLRDIDKHVEEIFKQVKENRDKMKNEVETLYKRKKKVNDVQMDELKSTISDINTKLSFLNQLLKSDEGTAMQSSETVITALKDRINELPKTEPDDNGQIYFLVNKQQMAALKQCDIGTVTQLRAADCLSLKGVEKSVIQGQKIVVKIIKTDEHEIYANQLKATWTHPTGETNISQVQEDDNGDYFVTGKCTSPGVCKLDVSADDEPIKQSPMIFKVEKEGLVNTIEINTAIVSDVVKCEDDCLLVSCWTNEMLKYKQSGEYYGKVTLPQDVQVDRMYKMKNGNIAFSDNNIKYIKICNMNGKVIKTIGEGVLSSSHGIHVGETSNVLYVAGSWSTSCVYMFDMNNGQTIKKIGSPGTKEGQMSNVIDVTLTKQGHLLILECNVFNTVNNRLQLFDNEGKFMKVLVEAGDENGKVRYPEAVVVDEDDNIIISSYHKLQLFSSDGNFIKRIDKPKDGIKSPVGLSIISYHPRRLAVANDGNKTVKIFNY